jgi:hypothetical protein
MQLPAYILARSFSRAVVDLLIPDAKQETTLTHIRAAVDMMPPGGVLKESLQALLKTPGTTSTSSGDRSSNGMTITWPG